MELKMEILKIEKRKNKMQPIESESDLSYFIYILDKELRESF